MDIQKSIFVLWISIVHAQIRFPVKSERQRMSECEDLVIQSAGTYVPGFGTIKKNVAIWLKEVKRYCPRDL